MGDQRKGGRLAGWAWGAGGTIIVAGLVAAVVGPRALLTHTFPQAPPATYAGLMFMNVSGLGLSAWAAVNRKLDRRTRQAWIWISAAQVLLLVRKIMFMVEDNMAGFPRPADLPRMAMFPVLLIGLLRLPVRSGEPVRRVKLALDAGIVVAASMIFLWYVQVGPAVTTPGATFARITASTAYPLGDALLIFGIAFVLTRGVAAQGRRAAWLLGAATLPWFVGDLHIGYVNSITGQASGASWDLLCVLVGAFLLTAAAFEQNRVTRTNIGPIVERASVNHVSRLPYVAVACGYAMLFVAAARGGALYPWGGLVLGAAVLTGLVVARQVHAQQESFRMAVTDGLTGLANRSRLHESLALALARDQRAGLPTGVLLIDLNGFKQINDTLGHVAGDRMLVAFSQMLRRSVLGSDVPGRLGGDEFAVVLPALGNAQNAEAVVRRLMAEMTQPIMHGDRLLEIRASIGIAVGNPGELDVDELFSRADIAMYEAKAQSRLSGATAWQHYQPASSDTLTATTTATTGHR